MDKYEMEIQAEHLSSKNTKSKVLHHLKCFEHQFDSVSGKFDT